MAISGFMIDMDGTVYKGNNVIPGAIEFIDLLNSEKIPYVFLTNNSSHCRDYYSDKLTKMGFTVKKENVLTSLTATLEFINTNRPGKKVFPLAAPDVIDEINDYGITIDLYEPDIVLLTFDKTITYDKLNDAYHFILKGAELIATHPDDVCPTEDSYDVDIGPFIRLFESLSGKNALVVGKPNRTMLEMAASVMGVPISETAMIGDRLYTDIKMAEINGITSILVLTGETSKEELADANIVPTHVVDTIFDITDLHVFRYRRNRERIHHVSRVY